MVRDINPKQLSPFGCVVNAPRVGASVQAFPEEDLKRLVDKHRVVVLREFAPLVGDALPEYCATLGTIAEFDFGSVNKLEISPAATNYLYTNSEVPFHWDGAFIGQIPHYIFFHCDAAPQPGSGGETLFTDTTLMLEHADRRNRDMWDKIDITYTTQKIVHYGGEFSSRMVDLSPTGLEVIRFAEPVKDLNPVSLTISGLPVSEHEDFLADMHRRLHDDTVCYRHRWRDGDVVIADNFVLLHGRAAFDAGAQRSIRRVNIL
jgi:alpha-ketoglutarate-dependent taurine dioxygenase